MPRPFSPSTAEIVAQVADAVVTFQGGSSAEPTVSQVSVFIDLPEPQTKSGLELAKDIGILKTSASGGYVAATMFAKFFSGVGQVTQSHSLHLFLSDYAPFNVFVQRLDATGNARQAAQQTKALFDLDAHADEIKDTLVSLGQFCGRISVATGASYAVNTAAFAEALANLSNTCEDLAKSELRLRVQIGDMAFDKIPRNDVVEPLSRALLKTGSNDATGAVVEAGNAVESFLTWYGSQLGHSVAGKHGINAKADELARNNYLPKKYLNVSKYLGHIRNAADHGTDAEIGQSWTIRPETGIEYTYVACSFLACVFLHKEGTKGQL